MLGDGGDKSFEVVGVFGAVCVRYEACLLSTLIGLVCQNTGSTIGNNILRYSGQFQIDKTRTLSIIRTERSRSLVRRLFARG